MVYGFGFVLLGVGIAARLRRLSHRSPLFRRLMVMGDRCRPA